MKLTAFDIAFIEAQRDAQTKENVPYDANVLCCERQDDACTLSAEDAAELLKLMHRFALVRCDDDEYYAVSAFHREPDRDDLSWCALSRVPDENGRFYCCSAYDRSQHFLIAD